MTTTKKEREEMRAYHAASAQGDWECVKWTCNAFSKGHPKYNGEHYTGEAYVTGPGRHHYSGCVATSNEDAEFIARVHADFPRLLEDVEHLEFKIDFKNNANKGLLKEAERRDELIAGVLRALSRWTERRIVGEPPAADVVREIAEILSSEKKPTT